MRERLLLTGPGGRVGTQIVPLLRPRFALRLFDLQSLSAEGDDQVIQGDIRNFAGLLEACRGVRAMVHLAAVSDEDDFHTRLLPMNLAGAYNAFEAARQAGVPKLVFASTGQTVLNYPAEEQITAEMPARPFTVYACTKLFGEALGRYYADTHGLSVICLRICWFQPYSSEALRSGHRLCREWCSPRDLTQILIKAVESDLRFGVFFAVSNNQGVRLDLKRAREMLGYVPEDGT